MSSTSFACLIYLHSQFLWHYLTDYVITSPYRRCRRCYRRKSLRTGSFFAEFPRVPIGKILICVFLWSRRELRTTVADYLRLTKNTVGNIYAVIRHYCGRDLQDRPVIPFAERLYVVKCDESQFGYKSKVNVYFIFFFKNVITLVR